MKIVLFDTETTGLLLPDDAPLEDQPKIIEFYGVAINEDFEILDEVNTFINPGEPLTEDITRITGIRDRDVVNAPSFEDMALNIAELFKDVDIAVAHNIAFDNRMLLNEFKRTPFVFPRANRDICTVEYWKQAFGCRITLSALYYKLFETSFKAHRAKNDVHALVRIFHHFVENGDISLDIY